ncbi:sensor histidine kinase [Solitalea longa]|uniref:Sensor histidine kinase n=1 Tax=Solitalea longa TaxID=2079460 RepID=A0A2S5A675_9SPHI|nr:histidine kinase [Solitalea longa]POY38016.1 sensor histidine kinase [Solitalea longa]
MATYPLKNKAFLCAFIILWIIWGVIHTVVLYYSFGFDIYTAVTDSLVSNIFLACSCALISYIFIFYRPEGNYLFTIIEILAITILWLIISNVSLSNIVHSAGYAVFLKKSLLIRFLIGCLIIGWVAVLSLFWYSSEEQEEHMRLHESTEKLAREAELFKLRQQLQPHFLFNSLNSISALIVVQPEEARTMIQQLSDFLRGTLKKEENQWVTADEEIQHLKLYLDIEKVRFSHRLETLIEMDEATRNFKLPPMLLQPIVENAIKFGLYDTTEQVAISIQVLKNANNELTIHVKNPFDKQTNVPQGTGFGLSSISRRLYLLFARNDLLETSTNGNIFNTTLRIPQTND